MIPLCTQLKALLRPWFSGVLGSVGLTARLHVLKCLFQTKRFCLGQQRPKEDLALQVLLYDSATLPPRICNVPLYISGTSSELSGAELHSLTFSYCLLQKYSRYFSSTIPASVRIAMIQPRLAFTLSKPTFTAITLAAKWGARIISHIAFHQKCEGTKQIIKAIFILKTINLWKFWNV